MPDIMPRNLQFEQAAKALSGVTANDLRMLLVGSRREDNPSDPLRALAGTVKQLMSESLDEPERWQMVVAVTENLLDMSAELAKRLDGISQEAPKQQRERIANHIKATQRLLTTLVQMLNRFVSSTDASRDARSLAIDLVAAGHVRHFDPSDFADAVRLASKLIDTGLPRDEILEMLALHVERRQDRMLATRDAEPGDAESDDEAPR